jgi:hypothetical protein
MQITMLVYFLTAITVDLVYFLRIVPILEKMIIGHTEAKTFSSQFYDAPTTFCNCFPLTVLIA